MHDHRTKAQKKKNLFNLRKDIQNPKPQKPTFLLLSHQRLFSAFRERELAIATTASPSLTLPKLKTGPNSDLRSQ